MSHGDPPRLPLCHAYVFSLMPLTHLSAMTTRLSPGLRYALFDDSSLSRTGSSCAQFSTDPYSLTRLDAILVLYFYGSYASLYLYLSDLYIYWVGDGTFPIFNLLCNHPKVVT